MIDAELREVLKSIRDCIESENKNGASTTISDKSFVFSNTPTQINFPAVQVSNAAPVTSGTHPSVLYFPNKWNGHKYWMAYTPYPVVINENPCIVVSDDGNTWVTPNGLTNPIAPPPPSPKYNSDTELVMVTEDRMRCYWREYGGGENSRLLYKETGDGINWSATVECTFDVYVDPLSPCIVRQANDEYKMWVGAGGFGEKMSFLKSGNGKYWYERQVCNTNIDGHGFIWHPMVWMTLGKYHCIAAVRDCNRREPSKLYTDLYYGKSDDGINWQFDETPILMRGEYGIKSYRVYRSCAVRVASDKYKLYISGLGSESEQIHVVDANKLK